VILYRCLPWNPSGDAGSRGGALWFPRELQGDGRHDAPERYGCLYTSEQPRSAVVEELGRFTGTELSALELRRSRRPLALAALELRDTARFVDLDDPLVLASERLRPSHVATEERQRSQAVALSLYERHEDVVGLRWSSAFDSTWGNVTLFDRALGDLSVADLRPLELEEELVLYAARTLGLRRAA
jgi:RES domain